MSNKRSRKDLIEFLDYLAAKGLMAPATIAARKAASSRVLGILTEDEASDVTKLNLEEVMHRFQNLEGKKFTPDSLTTYLGRVQSAVRDFSNYLKNPLGFRPSVQHREKRTEVRKEGGVESIRESEHKRGDDRPGLKVTFPSANNTILPIPIRQDVTVYVQGIPFDLTDAEAGKIANVIRAMAALK